MSNRQLSPLVKALASAGIVTWGACAFAQAAATPPAPAAPAASAPGAAASAPVASQDNAAPERPGSLKLEEVVVTAQKRSTRASKTPVSLSVITGDALSSSGTTSAANLTNQTPGVQIGLNNGSMNVNIRGVTSNDNTEKGDPSASFNLDGIYIARPQAAGLSFFDLERVEILRGPQGTLYGRNSTAGAVNVITAKPTNRLEGSASVELGNYDLRRVEGMVNVPVSDVLSLRAAVVSADHTGYIKTTDQTTGQEIERGRDDQKDVSARLHVLFKPSADTSLLLTGDHSKMKGNGIGSIDVAAFQADPTTRHTTVSQPGSKDQKGGGGAIEFKTGLGFADFTYLFGHRTFSQNDQNTLGSNPTPSLSIADFKQDSHELRLSSRDGGPLQWVAGLYSFKEKSKIDFQVFIAPGPTPSLRFQQDPVKSESQAAFGQATYAIVPELRVTAGLRHTRDKKSRQGVNSAFGFDSSNDASVQYSQSNWKLGVDYDLSKATMLYASVATGYKAGGFNDGTAATNPDLYYDPEHLTAFEVGVKGRFLDNKLQLTAAAFAYAYNDLQVSSVGASNTLVTKNAAKATISGLEFEGKLAVSNSDQISFGLGLLEAKYKDYTAYADGTPPTAYDWSGYRLDKSPRGTLSLGYTHAWTLESGAGVTAHLGSRYSSAYVVSDFSAATQYAQKAYTKTDFDVTFNSPTDAWFVQAYVRNIEDKTVISGYNFNTFTLSEPRLFGIRTGFRF